MLIIAALDGKISIGQVLIEWGADLNKRNKGGYTALSLAALTGHAPFIGLLLRSGASLDYYPFGRSLDGLSRPSREIRGQVEGANEKHQAGIRFWCVRQRLISLSGKIRA
ncbi:MAG: ankyrin repeat domain-containing protein [Acidobacteriaceae bacterium]